jgi:hypothetical protein
MWRTNTGIHGKACSKACSVLSVKKSLFIGDCIIAEIQIIAIIMAILIVHVKLLAIKKDGLAAEREILIMAGDV